MNFPNSNADLLRGLVEQLDDATSRVDRRKLLFDLIEEYLQRFMAFLSLHPDDFQNLRDSAFWRMVVVAVNQLDKEIRNHMVDLPDDASEDVVRFISSVRSLNQESWSAADRAAIDVLTNMMNHLRQIVLRHAQPTTCSDSNPPSES